MTYTCEHCGSVMKNAIGLRSHERSYPCQARSARQDLEARGYVIVRHSTTQRALSDCDIGGTWKTGYLPGGIGRRSRLESRYWAPIWIVTLLDDEAHLTATYKGMSLSEVIKEWIAHNPELPR